MVIGGIIALAVAAVAYFYAHSKQKTLRDMTLAETLTCGELGQLSAAAAEAVGTGSFGQACEVVGVAAPGAQGALTAPESGREVVWHRTLLTEHYTTTETDSEGKSREVDKTRVVAQHVSEDPFLVKDATGEIVVDPRGADMDEPFELTMHRGTGSAAAPGCSWSACSPSASLSPGELRRPRPPSGVHGVGGSEAAVPRRVWRAGTVPPCSTRSFIWTPAQVGYRPPGGLWPFPRASR